ncbi:MAG TPA: 2-oxo-4-hydroxy-4-carboxy-5-ureidoimidazoline decarboxylase, partial [Candidatus Acidoferrales bacterium]|nr:2-oxo-4-hydroxy-4-carboxy-5-ureidoimidazoline decarboxylase [Candidatus Acidoferrales bacterium]
LGIFGEIHRVEVDTKHFKGNYPDACSLEVVTGKWSGNESVDQLSWEEMLPRTKLSADSLHVFESELRRVPEAKLIRFNIFPDGGVSRLRIWGKPAAAGVIDQKLRWLNSLHQEAAATEFANCCGAANWVSAMVDALPFSSFEELLSRADGAFLKLNAADWREAFAHHPQIGERAAANEQTVQSQKWSRQEQSSAKIDGKAAVEWAEANREYASRFGHIFIICAAGRNSDEIRDAIRERMSNAPNAELAIAAEEQRKITRLRLAKLLGP